MLSSENYPEFQFKGEEALSKFAGSDKCPTCEKTVYFAEKLLGPGNFKYHKLCFKCIDCRKTLTKSNYLEKNNVVYCNGCHAKNYATVKKVYAGDDAPSLFRATSTPARTAIETTTTVLVSQENAEIEKLQADGESALSKAAGTDKCPTCEKTVYFAEKLEGPGNVKYHKLCFKCLDCKKILNKGNFLEKNNVIYCKGCHVKHYATVKKVYK